jgi:PAS domain S-box-containing protein
MDSQHDNPQSINKKNDLILDKKTVASPDSSNTASGTDGDDTLTNVGVPEPFVSVFLKAQDYVNRYFAGKKEIPTQGVIDISGERYILVRAASMSKEFFDLMSSLYQDRGPEEARNVTFSLLFDIAHAIGKADAKSFFAKMNVNDPIARLSAGPIHFSHTGWAFVNILPESNPRPDDSYYLLYDHPFSFEADTWLKAGELVDFPVCIMNAGYSSGWCEESFGISLVAAEIECRARGDRHCRFIMAPPHQIKSHISRYGEHTELNPVDFGAVDIPEFFKRKRLEDELRKHHDRLEELVTQRTDNLTQINRQLEREIAQRLETHKALQKSETMLEAIFNQTFQFIGVLSLDGTLVKANKTAMGFVGVSESEIIGRPFWETPWWSDSDEEKQQLKKAIHQASQGELVRFETVHFSLDGRRLIFDFSLKPFKDESDQIVLLIAEGRDISALKTTMGNLQKQEKQLKEQSKNLEEANIALKVVLKQVEEKRKEDKENILANIKQLVLPYVNRLKRKPSQKDQQKFIKTLETNLHHITSPLISKLSSNFLSLTPMEIRISHLVKEGLSNKEIAELLEIAQNTVSSHRYHIRSKLGLKQKGANLRSYLLSLDK